MHKALEMLGRVNNRKEKTTSLSVKKSVDFPSTMFLKGKILKLHQFPSFFDGVMMRDSAC